jgi:hypothetical protein
MPLNIRVPTPTAGEEACKSVKRVYADIANYIAHGLGDIVKILNDPATAAEFWQQQGTDGVANLVAFGKARDLLQEIAPDLVSAELAAAGSTLQVNLETGVVTVPQS